MAILVHCAVGLHLRMQQLKMDKLMEWKEKIRKIVISRKRSVQSKKISIFPDCTGDDWTQWNHAYGTQFFKKIAKIKKIAQIKISL